MNPPWGCANNEERSPYSTGRQTCAGELRYIRTESSSMWICDKHRAENERENEFWEQHHGESA